MEEEGNQSLEFLFVKKETSRFSSKRCENIGTTTMVNHIVQSRNKVKVSIVQCSVFIHSQLGRFVN